MKHVHAREKRIMENKHLIRGILAGVAGGVAAAWVMNEFSATLGKKLEDSVETPAEQRFVEMQSDGEDATMKAADKIAETVTGGQHLTHAQRETAGPVIHYTFGAVMGGLYGALAEYSSAARSGFGTTFGGILFAGADLVGVPAAKLGPWPTDQPASALANPLATHLVYGLTTELVRRIVRNVL
jgi:putative membrane protein